MISAIVLTKNSASSLKKCLQSLAWCGEIIVIDDFSTDATLAIAKKFKARIYKRKLNNNFAAQRNFGLTKAKNNWVLFLDSDETIFKIKIPEGNYDGFFVKRRDYWLGKPVKFGETNIRLVRLARKNSGKWKRRVHEYWDVEGKIGKLNKEIVHYPHPTVREFIAEISFYSRLHSQQNRIQQKSVNIFKVVFYPLAKFISNFIAKSGFRDGTHGFVLAGIMSFHSFLVWSDLWLTSRKRKF